MDIEMPRSCLLGYPMTKAARSVHGPRVSTRAGAPSLATKRDLLHAANRLRYNTPQAPQATCELMCVDLSLVRLLLRVGDMWGLYMWHE